MLSARRELKHVRRLTENVLKDLSEAEPGSELRLVKLEALIEISAIERRLRQIEAQAERELRLEHTQAYGLDCMPDGRIEDTRH